MELFILLEFPYVRVLYSEIYPEYQQDSEDSIVTLGPKIDIYVDTKLVSVLPLEKSVLL
jgi:hypothetical protein